MGMSKPEMTERNIVLIRRILAFLACIAGLWALQRFQSFLVPTTIGAFLALILTPIVAKLEFAGVRRGFTALSVVVVALLTLGTVVYAVLPNYEDYVRRAPEIVREIERKLAPFEQKAKEVGLIAKTPESPSTALPGAGGEVEGPKAPDAGNVALPLPDRDFYTDVALEAPALFGNFLYIVFLTFFIIFDRNRLMRMALATQSSYPARLRMLRVIRRIRTDVAQYLLAVTAINCGLGVATGLAFWALGMPNPLLWGVAMATVNFIPYLGAGLMNVVAFAVAFLHYPEAIFAFAPVAVLLFLNLVEGQFVTPMVIGSRLVLGALPVFFAVAFGAWLWGPAGAVLATPALIVVQAVARAWVGPESRT